MLTDDAEATRPLTAKQMREDRTPLLHAVWSAWAATLPPEAASTWRRGAAYIRESSAKSLAGSAPDVQLHNTLALLRSKLVYVPWEGVFFDNASGTDIGIRADFKRLFEQALAGGFSTIGVFVSERLFRNLEQAMAVKREFRKKGIEVQYLGRFEGDPRNPAAWQLEVMQDMTAELQARNTGYYVGTHLETLTRMGHPVGPLPEAYVVAERAPTFLGRQGSIIRWELQEPLASIIAEGRRRYMDGASYTDLARWSLETDLHGTTPKGRVMNMWWWRSTLRNPKYAGYQMPTQYQGYKPGRESEKRPRRNGASELVPCKLPALWTLDDHHALVALSRDRIKQPKVRKSYRVYLLSRIAVDERCGHLMSVHRYREDGHFWMVCRQLDAGGRHSGVLRTDVAQAELDELLAHLSFEDEALRRQIEEELEGLIRRDSDERERFRPNPAIAAIGRALAELRAVGLDDANLQSQLAHLVAADETRRLVTYRPIIELRAAIDGLQTWAEVWPTADVAAKNKLLRAAGVRVVIGRDQGTAGPAHLKSISAENHLFQLALVAALRKQGVAYEGQQPSHASYATVRLAVPFELAPVVTAAGLTSAAGDALVRRPVVADVWTAASERRSAAGRLARTPGVAPVRRRAVSGVSTAANDRLPAGGRRARGAALSNAADVSLVRRPVIDRVQTQATEKRSVGGRLNRSNAGPVAEGSVTVQEAAAIAAVAENTVVYWVRRGHLPAVKLAGWRHQLYIRRSDLETFLATRWSRSTRAVTSPEGCVTVAEAAAGLGVAPRTLRWWIQEGRIRALRNGPNGGYLMREIDVEQLSSRRSETSSRRAA